MSAPDYPLIPYGWADFRAIRLEGRLYVDKTCFLRPLENERSSFLIRPRRFGKSCWLSAGELRRPQVGRRVRAGVRRHVYRPAFLWNAWTSATTSFPCCTYFGLLSIRETVDGRTRLHIPNQTVRQLLYSHLRDGYDDAGGRRMANGARPELQPVFDFLRDAIAEQTGIHDYLEGEKVIQGFLAAYLGVSRHFLLRTEPELNKGFADISLEPLAAQYPELRHRFLIELKYIKRGEDPIEAKVRALREAAEQQLRRYLADDRLARTYPSVQFTGLAVVFHDWEMVSCLAMAP